jgi:hypothetical protein
MYSQDEDETDEDDFMSNSYDGGYVEYRNSKPLLQLHLSSHSHFSRLSTLIL